MEAVGRRGQEEVNRSIALPLCLMSYIDTEDQFLRDESHKEGRH